MALLGLVLVAPAPVAAQPPDGLVVLGTDQRSDRVQLVHLSTPALDAPTTVSVLLPEDYDPSGATRYPVLYILHGAAGSSTRWLELGEVEASTAGLPLIVVMPAGGLAGFYADWWNFGAGGAPAWETYHLDQLIPWIDATYPTVGTRDGRAIAGESMGGLGTMHYAATRPDRFTAAAAFSGAIDTNWPATWPIVEALVTLEGNHRPAAAFGPRLTEEVRYRGHNPVDLAENLHGLLLSFRVGDGSTGGPLAAAGVAGDPVEAVMLQMNLAMDQRLDALGIAHGFDAFPGCHCWPQWADDLRVLLPTLMDRFAHPVPPPTPFRYTSIQPSYGVWGWDVSIDRPALEFSRLFDAGPSGFGLTGSGSAVVTTAPMFDAGQPVTVTVAGVATAIAADGAGRLTVPVDLGPGNPVQQYSPVGNVLALANGGAWPSVTTTVTFEPVVVPAAAPVAAAAAVETPSAALPTTGSAGSGLAPAALVVALGLALARTRRNWQR